MTRDGIPLGYEVFAGNRYDATTVKEIVAAMAAKYGRANRIWVMDRGMVSAANLKFLRQRGGHYLVGTPTGSRRKNECRRTCWFASWPTSCGKRWRKGCVIRLLPRLLVLSGVD